MLSALDAKLSVRTVLAEPELCPALEAEMERRGPTLRPLPTAPKLLSELADLDAPRGAVAVVERPIAVFSADLDVGSRTMWVYADRVQDPTNLGALARVCAALKAPLLLSPGCAHPNHHRAVRGSAFSLLKLEVFRQSDWDLLTQWTASSGSQILGLDPRATTSIYDITPRIPTVAVIGGEMGIDPDRLQAIDTASIPMAGDIESLNLAVAAGIALFAWHQQAAH